MDNSLIYKAIAARFNNENVEPKKKNITFNIDEELLERLDSIVGSFNIRDGSTTRNAVIEDAITGYVKTAEDYLERQFELLDSQESADESGTGYDTAVFPAINDNFKKVFIGEQSWYHVRMAEFRTRNVKYVALYRGAPVSAITHYAEVTGISAPDVNNKRVISLMEPKALDKPIKLGNIHINNARRLFYTTLNKIKSVNTIEELIKK